MSKPFCILILIFVLLGCSSQKDALMNKAFHNLAAHYNGYYYANEEITKVEKAYQKALKDDYNRILRLYPGLDSAQAKGFEKELQEAIKMASLAIQYHQNSKWVDDSYILVGRARLYQLDWGNAIQTLKFVNTKTKDPEARHEAIIWLIRTFTEHKEYNNAQAALDFLQKQKLSEKHYKMMLLEKAYLAQVQNNLDDLVKSLSLAAPLLRKKSDRPGRIYFILGQVYQKLGFEAEAYNYYKKCLNTHPEYEVDFYARLYQAQVAEISKSKSVASARKSYSRLLKDSKNKDFQDKIYFEMGVFELKQKNETEAISYLNKALRLGNNAQVDGESHLKLAEHYYQKRIFENAKNYYDSAVATLPKDYENLDAIVKRKNILDEFVKHLGTIRLQDSLLMMARLDTATVRKKIENEIALQQKPVILNKKKKRTRIDISSNDNPVFGSQENNEAEGASWYFGSASAVAGGQNEFVRVWGEIALDDNWRRSQRNNNRPAQTLATDVSNKPKEVSSEPAQPINPVNTKFKELIAILPYTKEEETTALKKIEDALYHLGDIYSLQLNEPTNALLEYENLLSRFPKTQYAAEVLYRISLLTKENDKLKSETAARQLLENYPESAWAKLLRNPDYLTEAGKAVVLQKKLYEKAYGLWQINQPDSATQFLNKAIALGETNFTPNLVLLNALLLGSKKQTETYQKELENFLIKYSDHILTSYVKTLLDKVKSAKQNQEKATQSPTYQKNEKAPHYFVIYYTNETALDNALKQNLPDFNNKQYPGEAFDLRITPATENQTMMVVSVFTDKEKSMQYLNLFNDKLAAMTTLKRFNFSNFVITEENLATLTRTQKLNEYLVFYTRYYQTENP